MTQGYILIDDHQDLEPLFEAIDASPTLAIDTEADNMHHYEEKLCLIQIEANGQNWIVDAISENLSIMPLLERIKSKPLLMHGADYDMRLLNRLAAEQGGFRPLEVFDTMLAAQLVGRSQIGLAALVEEFQEVELAKKYQRADWSRRPLPEEMLDYASGDTRYLQNIVSKMRNELAEKGREEWHRESCERMLEQALTPKPDVNSEKWRIKGGRHFRHRAAAVLNELWHWREKEAKKLDCPPFKVANTDFILQWARLVEENPSVTYDEIPARPDWLRGSRRRGFELALVRALTAPPNKWPRPPKPVRRKGDSIGKEDESLMKKVLAVRDEVSKELELDPGVLAPREPLRQITCIAPLTSDHLWQISPLMKWQTQCLEEKLLTVFKSHKN